MAVARRAGVATATTTSVTSLSLTTPTTGPGGTVAVGDQAWLVYGFNQSGGDTPTPAGWTLVDTHDYSTTFRANLYHKTLAAPDLGATVTFVPVASQRLAAAMQIYSGANDHNALNFYVQPNTGATNTHTNPTVTSTATGVTVSFIVERSSTPDTDFSAPAGLTTAQEAYGAGSGSICVQIADDLTAQGTGSTLGGGVWTGAAGVTNNPIVTWTIGLSTLDTATAVGKNLGLSYNTRAAVNDTVTLRHNTRSIVGDGWTGDVNDLFDDLELNVRYNVLFGLATAVAGKSLGLVYKVQSSIGKDFTYSFRAGGTVGKDLNLAHNTLFAAGDNLSYVLNVLGLGGVGKNLGLVWKVRNPATGLLSVQWNVEQITPVGVENLEIDGLNMRTQAWNVSTRTGRLSMPAGRGDDLQVPGRSGYYFVPNKPLEAGVGALAVWVTGALANGTIPPTQTGRQAQFQTNFAMMQRIFMRRHRLSTIRAGQSDGSFRVAQVQWVEWSEPTVVAGGTRAEWSIGFSIPDVFWTDEATRTQATAANSTLPKTLDLTNFAGMTGIIEDAVYSVTGPISNPRITDAETGHYVELIGTVATGQVWVLDAANASSDLNGVSVLANTRHAGSYRLMTIANEYGVTDTPRLVLSGASAGSTTKLAIAAKRKWING